MIDEMSCNIYNVVLKYSRYQHCQHGKADNAYLKDAAVTPCKHARTRAISSANMHPWLLAQLSA